METVSALESRVLTATSFSVRAGRHALESAPPSATFKDGPPELLAVSTPTDGPCHEKSRSRPSPFASQSPGCRPNSYFDRSVGNRCWKLPTAVCDLAETHCLWPTCQSLCGKSRLDS